MVHEAEQAIKALKEAASTKFSGSIVEYPLFDIVSEVWGFGVTYGHGLTLVSASAINTPPGHWSVKMSSGLAAHAPDVAGTVMWANQHNRESAVGKYYCAIDQENNRSVVIYENYIHALMFNMMFGGPIGPDPSNNLAGWIKGVFFNNILAADEDGLQVAQAHGGERFSPDEDGLDLLFTASNS